MESALTPMLATALSRLLALSAFGPLVALAIPLKFGFGPGPVAPGYEHVSSSMVFTLERGYGFEAGATLTEFENKTPGPGRWAGLTSEQPFFFSVAVPAEGNYRVTVTLGNPAVESVTTIKAELRRLMVEKIHVAPGESATVSFIVNIRIPQITATGDIPAGVVKLKAPRETTQEAWAWDQRLTLEFNGVHPALCTVEIEPVRVPTIFLLGDSTVTDQSREPFASWGQMLPRFFKPEVAIANHSESGETYRDSIGRRRLDKILSMMQPGDWLLMQFGTNDQKQIAAGTGGPFTTYQEEIKRHVDAVRAHGGTAVIVSPMERRAFDEHGKVKPSLADYAEGSRQAAQRLGAAFIDLNALSIRFYEALEAHGREYSRQAFAGQDNTHHNNYGSYELAQCVVQGIRDNHLGIAKYIVDEFKGFDPAHPDEVGAVAVPPSPQITNQRPLGE
jgi:lysophospholipase L1-like esterase